VKPVVTGLEHEKEEQQGAQQQQQQQPIEGAQLIKGTVGAKDGQVVIQNPTVVAKRESALLDFLLAASLEAEMEKNMHRYLQQLDTQTPGIVKAKEDIPANGLTIFYRGKLVDTCTSKFAIDWCGVKLDCTMRHKDFPSPWKLKTNPIGNMQRLDVAITPVLAHFSGTEAYGCSCLTAPALVNVKEIKKGEEVVLIGHQQKVTASLFQRKAVPISQSSKPAAASAKAAAAPITNGPA
jgi:hypothetical protein